MHVEHGMKCGAPTITLPFRLRGIQMHGVCILLIGDMKLIIVPYFVDMHACPYVLGIRRPSWRNRLIVSLTSGNSHAQQTDQQRL
jgi:hypothetical protein